MIIASLLTKPNDKKALDRLYVKMKTPVDPVPEKDEAEIEKSYANPESVRPKQTLPQFQPRIPTTDQVRRDRFHHLLRDLFRHYRTCFARCPNRNLTGFPAAGSIFFSMMTPSMTILTKFPLLFLKVVFLLYAMSRHGHGPTQEAERPNLHGRRHGHR